MNQHTATETEHRCMRCGRIMTNKYSVRRGYGRGCQAKLRDAARKLAKIYTRAQVMKATTALREGKIRFIGDGVYAMPSSNGHDVYTVTAYTCDCPSRVRCYHQCAVNVREMTPVYRPAKVRR